MGCASNSSFSHGQWRQTSMWELWRWLEPKWHGKHGQDIFGQVKMLRFKSRIYWNSCFTSSFTYNRGQSRDAVVAGEPTECHVIGSFSSTMFMDSQLESAGTRGGQPFSSCFSEQFASHFPNFTLQLLLSSHCLNYLLLHKGWHFLWLRNSLPHTTLAALCLTKGRVVADSLVLAGPLKRHQASARGDYWQIGPIVMALPADCVRLSYPEYTIQPHCDSPKQMVPPNPPAHLAPFNKSNVEFPCPVQWCMGAKLCDDGWSH